MANTDQPSGFKVAGHAGGGTPRAEKFTILYSYATAIFAGDSVVLASGYVNQAADGSSATLGVFDGCEYVDNSGNMVYSRYWPGVALADSTKIVTASVYVDPQILYEVQTDTGTTTTIANVGVAYDIELDHSGSTITGQSGMELDVSDTTSGMWMVHGLSPIPGNAWGVNAKVLVTCRLPVMGSV